MMLGTSLTSRAVSWRRAAGLVLLAPAFWIVSTADAAPPDAPSRAINTMCPVMTEEAVDPKITLRYEGRTVSFCCDRCRAKFKENPAKYAGRLPPLDVGATAGGAPTLAGDGHDSGETEHHAADAATALDKSDGQGHDHGGSASESEDKRSPLLGRLHPAIVHFPVAGIPLALLGFVIWVATGRDAFAKADVPPLAIGTLAAVVAVVTGNIAHDAMQFSPAMHEIVERHQIASTTAMVIALCLLALRIWRWDTLTGRCRWVYGGGLILTSAVLGLTGYLGGSLVFGPDHLTW